MYIIYIHTIGGRGGLASPGSYMNTMDYCKFVMHRGFGTEMRWDGDGYNL